jgi:hypothetical protein
LKPKPTVTKITFTKEERQEIDSILERKTHRNTGHYPISSEYKIKLANQFYGGYCHVCRDWPSYKVLYDMNGAKLKEFYCLDHFKQYFPNEET